MSTTCTYVEHATRCTQPATHYTHCAHDNLGVWTLEDTPQQLESMNGFKMWDQVLDKNGRPILDSEGRPKRVPRMETREFCHDHAEVVRQQRTDHWAATSHVAGAI